MKSVSVSTLKAGKYLIFNLPHGEEALWVYEDTAGNFIYAWHWYIYQRGFGGEKRFLTGSDQVFLIQPYTLLQQPNRPAINGKA